MLENLICTQYERNFAQNLQDSLVIGKLAAKKYEEGMSFGDEKDVIMPGRVTMSDWAGGDLNTVEKVRSSIVKVKVDQGKQVNFEIEYAKAVQIAAQGEGEGQARLVDEYRKLTSLIFREILKEEKTNVIKANFMAFAVDFYQKFINVKQWKSLGGV